MGGGIKVSEYETASEIEIAIARHFGIPSHLSIPNVSWGFFIHECDVAVVTPSHYFYEVEIKISKQDLIRDKEKHHGHEDKRIKQLWFAIPEKLLPYIEHIPDHAGILMVSKKGYIKRIKPARINKYVQPLTEKDCYRLARLGAMRIWSLKERIKELETRVNK